MTYEELKKQIAEYYKTDPKLLEESMNKIAYHESGGSMDPTQQQYKGGPGRGLFQYEQWYKHPETGEYGQAGGMTARNRLAGFFGEDVPDWLIQEGMHNPEIGFDASRLTEEQQRMLFLADKRMTPGVQMTSENLSNLPEFWADSHWKGPSDQRDDKISTFTSDMNYYDTINNTVTEQGADAF